MPSLLNFLRLLSLPLTVSPVGVCLLAADLAQVDSAEGEQGEERIYELEDFSVVAERFGQVSDFSLVSVQVLDAGDLQRQVQSTLGETLAWQPGLSASYFGPGASRPVIRGLGDYRVRMLINDIGTLDVSDNSPDHGLPLEPLLIRRVDVHRGPDALLFGNAAIGGAINSQTRHLPESLPGAPVSGSIEARYETASESRSAAAYGTARAGDLALRVTGARRSAGDYKIAGQARTSGYEQNADPPNPYPTIKNTETGQFERVPNPSETLPNTHIDTETHSVGALWAPESGFGSIGIAHSRYESEYGLPYQYEGSASTYGDTGLDMWQSRYDLEMKLETKFEQIERVRFRLGHADYGHEEIFTGREWAADTTFVDTIMGLESSEARIDFYHRLFEGLEGVAGIHGFERELDVSVLRLFSNPLVVPLEYRYETRNLGAFLVETWKAGPWTIRGGYRFERQSIEDLSPLSGSFIPDSKEEAHSLALGLTWRDFDRWFFDEIAFTLNMSRIERLQTETERYASWSNAAIQRFVVGTYYDGQPYELEKSDALELGVEFHLQNWSGRINVYRYDFEDFIFLSDRVGLTNQAWYVAKDAKFIGGEAELTWLVHENEQETLKISGMVDFVQGENETDETYLPRIPPLRIGSRVEYERGNFTLGADLRYAFEKDKVQAETASASLELPTEPYVELNIDAEYIWVMRQGDLTVFARLENALDEERRSHASFLKEIAPLPGRNFSFGARWRF